MDDPVCRATIVWNLFLTTTFHLEIQGAEEEHRQLPLDENVPQGCRSSQEGRCPRLNHLRAVRRLPAEASCLGVWDLFLIQYLRETSDSHHNCWFGSVILHQVMGVGFYSYVQYTTLDMESPVKTLIIIFIVLATFLRPIRT